MYGVFRYQPDSVGSGSFARNRLCRSTCFSLCCSTRFSSFYFRTFVPVKNVNSGGDLTLSGQTVVRKASCVAARASALSCPFSSGASPRLPPPRLPAAESTFLRQYLYYCASKASKAAHRRVCLRLVYQQQSARFDVSICTIVPVKEVKRRIAASACASPTSMALLPQYLYLYQ